MWECQELKAGGRKRNAVFIEYDKWLLRWAHEVGSLIGLPTMPDNHPEAVRSKFPYIGTTDGAGLLLYKPTTCDSKRLQHKSKP